MLIVLNMFVYQIYGNQLLLMYKTQHLDGDSNGPKRYFGPTGKELQNCENLPVSKINTAVPFADKTDLKTDQKYQQDICT